MKNWMTTIFGVVAGIGMVVNGAMENKRINPEAPPVTVETLWPGIAIAVLGAVAKDRNVTGGTKRQD